MNYFTNFLSDEEAKGLADFASNYCDEYIPWEICRPTFYDWNLFFRLLKGFKAIPMIDIGISLRMQGIVLLSHSVMEGDVQDCFHRLARMVRLFPFEICKH